MKGTGVYSITNKVNGKRYVGSASTSFVSRWRNHKSKATLNKHHSNHFQKAWNKYGAENFVFEVLATCPREYCVRLEQWFLDNLNPEYNVCKTAGSTLGIKMSLESRKKNSERQKTIASDPNVKKAKSERMLKLMSDPEYFKKNREAVAKGVKTESARKKNSEARK